jgi:site-specific DNA-methyltransferase (adenine-specific)
MIPLRTFNEYEYDLIYLDPPFNTGKTQRLNGMWYADNIKEYFEFLTDVLRECKYLLSATGSIFLHLDYRSIHRAKLIMDNIFGEDNFQNEIIWAYDYGARSKKRWSTKHDNILWYTKNHKKYTYNYDAIDRIPYMAPGLVGKEKAARGKTPTDCWFHTIVHTTGKERTGYPTQKPLGILNRIVRVHSNEGDKLLDPFAGSGSFGEAALINNRDCDLIDSNVDALGIMHERFMKHDPVKTDYRLRKFMIHEYEFERG